MYDEYTGLDYDIDDDLDIDISDYKVIEDEECSCLQGCFNCLEMSWKDFM